MMRQTHPQLAGTIREKKIKFGQQLNEVSWKEEKKADAKVPNEIDPANGPDTQCKNAWPPI